MARVDWSLRGPQLATCSCDWGCPCQFNARPTRGDCRAAVAMRIERGHFGDLSLDGLKWAGLFAWPGAIHEGHGEVQPIIDEGASSAQRDALLQILSGQQSEPGTTYFDVFFSTIETVHEPLFLPISFEADIAARRGRFSVPEVVEAVGEPIRNPMTGAEHRARVALPAGFEYGEAEFGSSTTRASGKVPLDWGGRHAHFALIDIGPTGPHR